MLGRSLDRGRWLRGRRSRGIEGVEVLEGLSLEHFFGACN